MPKLAIFCACPFTLFPLDDYKRVFTEVGRAMDVGFRFADEQITNQSVLDKITGYIRDADFSLFDITGWNPNVALELGIAVGMGQKYFILFNPRFDERADAPADIRGIDRLQYTSNSELEAKLLFLVRQELPKKGGSESAFEGLRERIKEVLSRAPNQKINDIAALLGEEKIIVQSVVRSMVQSEELVMEGATRGATYSITAPRRSRRSGNKSS